MKNRTTDKGAANATRRAEAKPRTLAAKGVGGKSVRRKTTRNTRVGVRLVVMEHGAGLALPAYQSEQAAGLDLQAALPEGQPLVLKPRQWVLVPTGLVLELPDGYEAQVRPRSGLALRHGVTVLNSPGTIDADYRGEVQVMLINHGTKVFRIERGERIAQLVVAPVVQVTLTAAGSVSATTRGAGGFGSTGLRAREAGAMAKVEKRNAAAEAATPAKRKSTKR